MYITCMSHVLQSRTFHLCILTLNYFLHSSFHNINSSVTLEPSVDSEAQTFINGTAVTGPTVLHHVRDNVHVHV